MKIRFKTYGAGEEIPVIDFLKNKKLSKYCSRETACAVICAAELLSEIQIDPFTPFFYETGPIEFQDFGLDDIVKASLDDHGNFQQAYFVERGSRAVPPLTQFKALYNIPLSLVSIEYGLKGENGVIYGSAAGLLLSAQHAADFNFVLLGCGRVYHDGSVGTAFAYLTKDEIHQLSSPGFDDEGIVLFQQMKEYL